jgi:hypothetical protein
MKKLGQFLGCLAILIFLGVIFSLKNTAMLPTMKIDVFYYSILMISFGVIGLIGIKFSPGE